MRIDAKGEFYIGDLIPGDRDATPDEIAKYLELKSATVRVAEIDDELLRIDIKTVRALRDLHSTGDDSRLKLLEEKAAELRRERVST